MAEDYEFDADFRAAVADELAGLENMMYRLGDGFQVAALRAPSGDGEYVTVGYFFRQVFMPAVKVAEPDEPAVLEPPEAEGLPAEVADAEAEMAEAPA
jgi:hypothetical protein